jgi:hypothetical protein
VAVGFGGTQVVSGLMLLANIYLLCWDYDRWKELLPGRVGNRHLGLASTLGLALSALSGFVGMTRLHLARLRDGDMLVPARVVTGAAIAAIAIAWLNMRSARR